VDQDQGIQRAAPWMWHAVDPTRYAEGLQEVLSSSFVDAGQVMKWRAVVRTRASLGAPIRLSFIYIYIPKDIIKYSIVQQPSGRCSPRPPLATTYLLLLQELCQRNGGDLVSSRTRFDACTTSIMTEVAESVPEAPSVPALPVVVPEEEVTDVNTALRIVLRKALAHGGLSRGLRESVRALDSRKARLCVLAMSCDEPAMVKLVQALCAEHGINLICVPDGKELGEWAGLCKLDADGTPRKVVSCSCVVVKDFGEPSKGLTFLENYLKEQS